MYHIHLLTDSLNMLHVARKQIPVHTKYLQILVVHSVRMYLWSCSETNTKINVYIQVNIMYIQGRRHGMDWGGHIKFAASNGHQTLKGFQLQGVCLPEPLTMGSATGPCWGLHPRPHAHALCTRHAGPPYIFDLATPLCTLGNP